MSTAITTYSIEVIIAIQNNKKISVDVTEEHTAQDLIDELMLDEILKLPRQDPQGAPYKMYLVNAQTKARLSEDALLPKDSKFIMSTATATYNVEITIPLKNNFIFTIDVIKERTAQELIDRLLVNQNKLLLPRVESPTGLFNIFLINKDTNCRLLDDDLLPTEGKLIFQILPINLL